MKLTTMSRRYLSSLMDPMKRDRRSSPEAAVPSFRRCRMTSAASVSTRRIASRSSRSSPTLSNRFSFQNTCMGAVARRAESIEAVSNASANADIGRSSSRQAGSRPNEILHMQSKAKRRNTSWRSSSFSLLPPAEAE
uniref:Uncharacterized protein n=1 Tax=Arundo donax TaxID=35708 RepID=A0A0A9G1R2_ARUDO